MFLISTPSSSLTHLCFRKWSLSQALWDLSEQEISYKSWPLAPGCSPPCEKIRNYNSIITIINSLSRLHQVQVWSAAMNAMFCFLQYVGQLSSWAVEHIPCKYQLTLLCFRMFISFSWAERHRNKSISWVDRLNVRWMSGGNKHIWLSGNI